MENTSKINNVIEQKLTDIDIEKMLIDLKEFNTEKDRLIETCESMILMYQDKIDAYKQEKQEKLNYVLQNVAAISDGLNMKETKTQFSYKLPSGSIVKKKASKIIQLNYDDMTKIPNEYIKVKESVNWAEFKKVLHIDGENVVNTATGEIVECCVIAEVPEEIKIKL